MKDYLMKTRVTVLLLFLCFVLSSCKREVAPTYLHLDGETWGTYWKITLDGDRNVAHKDSIIKILKDFDASVSTYVKDSHISRFNKSKDGISLTKVEDLYFEPVYRASHTLFEATDGYLDVSVMPLLNYWGFGYKAHRVIDRVDSLKVKKLMELTDLASLSRSEKDGMVRYTKGKIGVEIDFSAIAKGYGIDVIAAYLDKAKVKNYLIDIGGEARARGLNESGNIWTLAINKPDKNAAFNAYELIFNLHNASLATSGNYREMISVDGKQYGHILDPKTGFPGISDVLSATIVAKDCMTADGLATACVSAGLDKAKQILSRYPDVQACLIYDEDGDDKLEKLYINGFDRFIVE